MDQDPEARLRFQRPSLPSAERIEQYMKWSRQARWFSNGGPCWKMLSARLSERVNAHCVPVASGTAGLFASIAAVLDHAAVTGRDALLPSFTFPATAQAALWNGLRPRLLDVDPAHWHLDPVALERELVRRRGEIAVVIPVSSFGAPPPSDVRARWERACADAGVPLVVDSAAGFGAVANDGRPIGVQGDVEVVSFHATKPFAVGEGGAVFTRRRSLAARVEQAINFGFGPEHSVSFPRGLNGKLSEMHCAVALAVLDDFDAVLDARRAAAARVRRRSRPTLGWQAECARSTWQFVPVCFEDAAARTDAVAGCGDALETRVYYEPLHRIPAVAEVSACDGQLDVTDDLAGRVLALPMANDLTSAEIDLLTTVVAAPRSAPVSARDG